jgi:hypothetical protein
MSFWSTQISFIRIGVIIFTCDEKHCWKQKLESVHPRIVSQIGKWRHDHFLISTMFGTITEGLYAVPI